MIVKNFRIVLTISVLALIIIACEKEEPSTAVIKGKVTESGTPIENADVGLKSLLINQSTKQPQFEMSTVTDVSGNYQFSDLLRGDYEIGARWTDTANKVYEGGVQVQINKGSDKVTADIQLTYGPPGSCPYVYLFDGDSYHFNGDIYAGAIYSSLERDDYMPLSDFKPYKDQYQLKISNELEECQYTNLAELLIIKHPENTSTLIDRNGVIQTFLAPQPPVKAVSLNNRDYSQTVSTKDNNQFLFNEDEREADMNGVIMTFDKPDNADTGKLIVNAKNSLWLGYIHNQFTEHLGTYYNKWAEKQKQVSAEEHINQQLKRGILLSVYLETKKGWEFVDYFNLVGAVTTRDMVMSIDLSKAKSNNVRIKLESGFMFWELDYAAMDFSNNIPVDVTILKPNNVIDKNEDQALNHLLADDKYYLKHINGDEAIVQYDAIPIEKGIKQTIILHTKGYYEEIKTYQNKPDWVSLAGFKRKGTFNKFSKNKYYEVLNVLSTSSSSSEY